MCVWACEKNLTICVRYENTLIIYSLGYLKYLKLPMNCLKASALLESGKMMLMSMLAVSTLSLFTFITGPKGRKNTSRVKS